MKKKDYFSIRKLKVGIASIAISSLFLGVFNIAQAQETQRLEGQKIEADSHSQIPIDYVQVDISQLAEADYVHLNKEGLSRQRAIEADTFVLVYKETNKASSLPRTGEQLAVFPLLLGIGTVLILLKKKKGILTTVAIISLSGTGLLASSVVASELLLSIQQQLVASGEALTAPEIQGYEFVGYILDEDIQTTSPLYSIVQNVKHTRTQSTSSSLTNVEKKLPPLSSSSETTDLVQLPKEKPNKEEGAISSKESSSLTPSIPSVPQPSVPEEAEEAIPPVTPVPEIPSTPEAMIPSVPQPSVPEEVEEATPPVTPVPETPSTPEGTPPSVPQPSVPEEVEEATPSVTPVPDSPSTPEATLPSVPQPSVPEEVEEATPPVTPVPEIPSTPEASIPLVPQPSVPEEVEEATPPVTPVPEIPSTPEGTPPSVPQPSVPEEAEEAIPPVTPVPDTPSTPEGTLPSVPQPSEPEEAEEATPPVTPVPEIPSTPEAMPPSVPQPSVPEEVEEAIPPVTPVPETPSTPEGTPPSVPQPSVPEEAEEATPPVTPVPDTPSTPEGTPPSVPQPSVPEEAEEAIPPVTPVPEIPDADEKPTIVIPPTVSQVRELDYRTIYKANEQLEYGHQTESGGVKGKETRTTVYHLDEQSGQIVSTTKTSIIPSVDKIVTIGTKPTVEVTTLAYTTVYNADPTKPVEFLSEIEGKEGREIRTTTYQLDTVTGKVTSHISTKRQNPIAKIVTKGTKPTITITKENRNGKQVEVTQKIEYILDPSTGNVRSLTTENVKNIPQSQKELNEKKIELKNVQTTALYKLDSQNKPVRVPVLETATGTYQLKVTFDNGRNLWLDVTTISEKDGKFVATAILADTVQMTTGSAYTEGYQVEIPKANAVPADVHTSFKSLIDAIRKNPQGHYKLGRDVSADEVTLSTNDKSYIQHFSGILEGVGNQAVAIYDLKKPLFTMTTKATIKNINLKEVDIVSTIDRNVGALAGTVDDHSNIENVTATGRVVGEDEVGGLVGRVDNQSRLTDVAFSGYVASAKIAGGIAGAVTRDSNVQKAYADITIGSTAVFDDVKVGGLVGTVGPTSSVSDAYVEGRITNYSLQDKVGGAIGNVDDTFARLSNLISAVKVTNGASLIGNMASLDTSKLSDLAIVEGESTGAKVVHASLTQLTPSEAQRKKSERKQPVTNKAAATDYTKISGYQATKQIAYQNVEKLLPFFDRKTIIEEANKLAINDNLSTKILENVIATNNEGKPVHNLFEQIRQLTKLQLQYTDGTKEIVQLTNPENFNQSGLYTFTVGNNRTKFHLQQFIRDNRQQVATLTSELNQKMLVAELFNQENINKNRYDSLTNVSQVYTLSPEQKIGKLFLETTFNKTKENLSTYLHYLADSGDIGLQTSPFANLSETDKKALLVGLAYIDRWYDFGELNKQLLTLSPSSKGNVLDMIIGIGKASTDTLDSRLTATAYTQLIAPYTKQDTVVDLIKQAVRNEKGDVTSQTIDDWITEKATAYIYRTTFGKDQKAKVLERLTKAPNTHILLPLLSGKDNHVYVVFTSDSMIIGANGSQYNIPDPAQKIQRFFDFVRRIVNDSSKERLSKLNLIAYDSHVDIPESHSIFKNLMGPIGTARRLSRTDAAHAVGQTVFFVRSNFKTDSGVSTLTHEYVHNIDSAVLFDGNGLRHGKESYAMGLFQSLGATPNSAEKLHGFNLAFDRSSQPHRLFNGTPERFQSVNDLHEYYRRLFDVIYTLDAAEGKALVKKGAQYIQNNYKKLIAVDKDSHSGLVKHKNDSVVALSDLGTISSVDDLVDSGVVARGVESRDYHTGRSVYHDNGYYTIDLFQSQYGILENSEGYSGGFTLRRIAFELLAEKGYYEGLVPYVSNQYIGDYYKENTTGTLSDTYIFKKIFDKNEYADFKDFRKKMFKRREANAAHLRPITIEVNMGNYNYRSVTISNFDDLVKVFDGVLEREPNNPFAITNIKDKIFREYFNMTNEFSESIYKETLDKSAQ